METLVGQTKILWGEIQSFQQELLVRRTINRPDDREQLSDRCSSEWTVPEPQSSSQCSNNLRMWQQGCEAVNKRSCSSSGLSSNSQLSLFRVPALAAPTHCWKKGGQHPQEDAEEEGFNWVRGREQERCWRKWGLISMVECFQLKPVSISVYLFILIELYLTSS